MPELLYILAGLSNLSIQSTQQMATRLIPASNPASNHIITLSIIYNRSLFIKRVYLSSWLSKPSIILYDTKYITNLTVNQSPKTKPLLLANRYYHSSYACHTQETEREMSPISPIYPSTSEVGISYTSTACWCIGNGLSFGTR